MRFLHSVCLVLLVTLCCHDVFCQRGGNCWGQAPAPRSEGKVFPKSYQWVRHYADKDYLYESGRLVGCWCHKDKAFTSWSGAAWGASSNLPPTSPPVIVDPAPLGVNPLKIRQDRERIMERGGKGIEQSSVDAPDDGKPVLVDDRDAFYVTVIAKDAAERAKVLKFLEDVAVKEDFGIKVKYWSAAPDHWSVKCGFKTDVDSVILQAPTGEVLHRQESLDPTAAAEALRRANPKYDPAKDPSGPIDNWFKGIVWSSMEPYAVGGGLGLLVLLMLLSVGKKKG